MFNTKTLRIILDLLIFLAILQGWWLVALPLALFGAWKFPYFMEMILAGIIYDSLFGLTPSIGIWGYVGMIVAVGAFLAIAFVKRVVR